MSADPEVVDIVDPDGPIATAAGSEDAPPNSQSSSVHDADPEGSSLPTGDDAFCGEFETLPLACLETPEEAQQERDEAAFRAEAAQHAPMTSPSPSRRSSRRSRKEPRQLSARQIKVQRRAKFIIYGGITLAALVVIGVASYKLPIMLYNMGKMEKPYIWPWGGMWREWEADQAADSGTILKTKDGRQFKQEEINALGDEARAATATCSELYVEASKVYDGGEGDKVKALVLMVKAYKIMGPIYNRLEKVEGLKLFEHINRKAKRLMTDIGLKVGSWKKDLSFQEADRFQEELKKAGLAEE